MTFPNQDFLPNYLGMVEMGDVYVAPCDIISINYKFESGCFIGQFYVAVRMNNISYINVVEKLLKVPSFSLRKLRT